MLPPSPLYKYVSLASETHWQRIEALLKRGQIYFSSPDHFNDLFDVRPDVVVPAVTDPRYRKRLDDAGRRLGHGASVRRRQIAIATGGTHEAHATRFVEMAMRRIREVGVFCVTPHNDNDLMWAHYGNAHAGVCIGFRADRGPLAVAQRVEYSDAAPLYNHLDDNPGQFNRIFMTKRRHWEYEDEYRLVSLDIGDGKARMKAMEGLEHDGDLCRFIGRNPGAGPHYLSRDLIASITFGHRCPDLDRRRLADLVAQERLTLPLSEVFVDTSARTLRVRLWEAS